MGGRGRKMKDKRWEMEYEGRKSEDRIYKRTRL